MSTRKITLSLPEDPLRKVKLLAVERDTSVSGLMTSLLADLVRQEAEYARPRRGHLAWLEHGADLGTSGRLSVRRDELHDR